MGGNDLGAPTPMIRRKAMNLVKLGMGFVALMSGFDDLLESWFGVIDLFHLDVTHGVVLTALMAIIDPILRLIEDSETRAELRRHTEER